MGAHDCRLDRYIVIDLAFVIQGNDEEELPEHILGSCRLSRIDLAAVN